MGALWSVTKALSLKSKPRRKSRKVPKKTYGVRKPTRRSED